MAYASTTHVVGGSLSQKFADLRANWSAAAQKRAIYRKTLNELSALSDRELTDLGIARGNIAVIAREAAKI